MKQSLEKGRIHGNLDEQEMKETKKFHVELTHSLKYEKLKMRRKCCMSSVLTRWSLRKWQMRGKIVQQAQSLADIDWATSSSYPMHRNLETEEMDDTRQETLHIERTHSLKLKKWKMRRKNCV